MAGLGALANKIRVPYPILLVVGGLGLGFLPGADRIELDPELVLAIFLPPLLYGAAFFTNVREMRNNARPIGLLAIGLTIATTGTVALTAHYLVGLDWAVAFVLGAVVSPTDAVAPTQIVRRLGVPRRIVSVIEGENLTNDWAALAVYRFAVAAVVTGSFSLPEAAGEFLLTGVGGLAIGLLVGVVLRWVRKRVDDPPIEITISLFSAYAAYLPAEQLGVSGVLAVVTVGVYMGWHASELTTPQTRLELFGIWGVLQFLLNAVLFVLVGLQMPRIMEGISGESAQELLGDGVLIAMAVIVTRLIFVYVFTRAPRLLSRRLAERDPYPGWRPTLVIAWCSMRGAVALAAALAIPFTVQGGAPFPDRDLIVFLTYVVILATLVLQGLTLAPLIRWTGLEEDGADGREELVARLRAAQAAEDRVEELAFEEWVAPETAERMRGMYAFRRRRFEALTAGAGAGADAGADADADADGVEDQSQRYQRLTHEVIAAERRAILELRNSGAITDEVLRRVERDLDLEEARLDA